MRACLLDVELRRAVVSAAQQGARLDQLTWLVNDRVAYEQFTIK